MKEHIILFLVASPRGPEWLASGQEARVIEAELERGEYGDCFDLQLRWADRSDLLHFLLKLKPSVIHFSGHGGRNLSDEQPIRGASYRDFGGGGVGTDDTPSQHGLFFQDAEGNAQFVSDTALVETLAAAGGSVKLVVLNACYSVELAKGLLAHVDCVAGMSGSVRDDAARDFAAGFYGGLAQGESVAASCKQGRAAIRMTGLRDANLPQLAVRTGVDPKRYVLATGDPNTTSISEPRTSRAQLPRLIDALADAFSDRVETLREIALQYDRQRLAATLPASQASIEDVASSLVRNSYALDGPVLESVVRSARRKRPDHAALARAVSEIWPFAGQLDFACIDELRACLHAAGVGIARLRDATQLILGAVAPPLWDSVGAESFDDLIEGLALCPGRPPALVLVVQQLRHIPGVAAWIRRVAPDSDAPALPARVERLLLLLRQTVNDNYHGDVYLSDRAGRPRFLAALHDQAPLDQIPAVFKATCGESEDLQVALSRRPIGMVDVMLPVRDLLVDVERWDLFGRGPIGLRHPVVVRPLERTFAMRCPEYLGGAMRLHDSWEMLQRAPAIQQVALELDDVNAVLREHLQYWCVAAFRCPDLTRADRLAALDVLVKSGVAAMLALRNDHAWPDLERHRALPDSVHEYRRKHPERPVTLLWDDVDFTLGNTK